MDPATGASPRSVLLVDADDETRAMYAQAFTSARWQVADAESGPIALAKALALLPDVIVTEVRLLGIDGYDLVRILRRDADTATTPIIVITGDTLPASIDRARVSGADAVLSKPCVPDLLITRAAELVARRAGAAPRRPVEPSRSNGTPALSMPPPMCPDCGNTLVFSRAHSTHVGHRTEQWLHYACRSGCGHYEYRQRTRKLRKIS